MLIYSKGPPQTHPEIIFYQLSVHTLAKLTHKSGHHTCVLLVIPIIQVDLQRSPEVFFRGHCYCPGSGFRGRHDDIRVLCACDPMDCSLPGSSALGIFLARTLEWVISPSKGSDPGIKPASPALQVGRDLTVACRSQWEWEPRIIIVAAILL